MVYACTCTAGFPMGFWHSVHAATGQSIFNLLKYYAKDHVLCTHVIFQQKLNGENSPFYNFF